MLAVTAKLLLVVVALYHHFLFGWALCVCVFLCVCATVAPQSNRFEWGGIQTLQRWEWDGAVLATTHYPHHHCDLLFASGSGNT